MMRRRGGRNGGCALRGGGAATSPAPAGATSSGHFALGRQLLGSILADVVRADDLLQHVYFQHVVVLLLVDIGGLILIDVD